MIVFKLSEMAKLEALTYEINDYEEYEPLVPSLIDTLALMIGKATTKEFESLAQITINCVNNILKLINDMEDNVTNSENSLISRETIFSEVKANVNKTMIDTISTAMKNYLAKCESESIKKEIRNIISSLEKKGYKLTAESPKKTDVGPKEFASPKVQEVKKTKRKEASIVNKVVENGEEYVVVKSNWKFNPKNLTENQKEKFQRKRDIPALYQDLSQSQDEFQMSTWKTDSQDTSQSTSKSSKSATNNDASEILKNMQSTDVVPKIMENILDNAKNNQQKNVNTSPVPIDKVLKVDKVATPKSTKSPRMALKDRVFRNVRNLIEQSSLSQCNEVKDLELSVIDNAPTSPIHKPNNEITGDKVDPKQIDSVSKSPVPKQMADDNLVVDKDENETAKPTDVSRNKVIIVTAKQNNKNITLICSPLVTNSKKDNNVPNSAPPLLSTERPARMKRKPKKFDDSLLLAFKKSRHSNIDFHNDTQESNNVQPEITVAQVHTSKDKNDSSDTNQAPKIVSKDVEAMKNVNEGKAQVVTGVDALDDVIIMDCCVPEVNIESCTTEKAVATPTTPILEKDAEKSPEKPTTVVNVPSDMYKAAVSVEKRGIQMALDEINMELPIAKTPLSKVKEAIPPKSSTQRNKAQTDKYDKQIETITTPLNKIRKAKLQNDDLVTAATTTSNKPKDLNEEKSSTNTSVVEIETDKDNNKLEELSTPLSKSNKAKDVNQQQSLKKCIIQKETNEKSESEIVSNKTKEINPPKSALKSKETQPEDYETEHKEVSVTPKNKVKDVLPKSSMKKTAKKSRIEKELMIDTVEGHPFLKAQSEQRLTRNKILEAENNSRRKTLAGKMNKSKLEATPKTSKKPREKKISPTRNTITVDDSQDRRSSSLEDAVMDETPCSEDIIESSQDSTITTISVSTKRKPKRLPIVALEKLVIKTTQTQDLIQDSEMMDEPDEETHEKTDIELPQNKTAEVDKNTTDLTENMDTEPLDDKNASVDVIVLDETEPSPIVIHSEPIIGPETQELADADTQPNDPKDFIEFEIGPEVQELADADTQPNDPKDFIESEKIELIQMYQPPITKEIDAKSVSESIVQKEVADNVITQSLPEVLVSVVDTNDVSSPFKDDNLRKQDFLNNTLEISPIKIQSPDREKKSPSPETSGDFVVIQLSSPVHSNGEPFEKHGSPEFFTEDKVSPDRRDSSPPRPDVAVANTSPSSSLSLKKNRPQVRAGGRAAQMLDLLCVNSDLKVTKVPAERTESEETKKAITSCTSTPARRNLRILYNSVGDISDNLADINMEDTDNFLKLSRTLPTVTSSPSGPILKRKLVDITDEATVSPASKVFLS